MFNSNICYSNWFFKCQFTLFGCTTFVIDTETVQWSVLMFWGLSWDRRLYNAPDERWREKHVYKDLRNKAQHLCAFFPSCKPSYICSPPFFRRESEAVVWEGHEWWLCPFALSALFRYYSFEALDINWCSICSSSVNLILKPRGVLWVSSDGDDRMGSKSKPKKNPFRASNKTPKIPGQKINPQKIPCQISEP